MRGEGAAAGGGGGARPHPRTQRTAGAGAGAGALPPGEGNSGLRRSVLSPFNALAQVSVGIDDVWGYSFSLGYTFSFVFPTLLAARSARVRYSFHGILELIKNMASVIRWLENTSPPFLLPHFNQIPALVTLSSS